MVHLYMMKLLPTLIDGIVSYIGQVVIIPVYR